MADPAPTSNELAQQRTDMASVRTHQADERTDMAVDRTVLAHERTLMAWIRTSTSLISFGFTIYKFFQYLREEKPVSHAGMFGPREFAMMMIIIGILALLLATIDHRGHMVALRAEYGASRVPYSMSAVLAALIALLGVLGLVLVIFHQ
jgi:putative membrane protein